MVHNNSNKRRKLQHWLNQPYSYIHNRSFKRWQVLSITLYVPILLIFFQPMNIRMTGINWVFILYLMGYGPVSGFVVWLFEFPIYKLTKQRLLEWKKSHMLAWYLALILTLCVANYIYYNVFAAIWSDSRLILMPDQPFSKFSYKVLILFSSWAVISSMYCRLIHHEETIVALKAQPKDMGAQKDNQIILTADNQGDGLQVSISQLVFLEVVDNYVNVHYLQSGDELKQRLMRTSLQRMEEQLTSYGFLRCHQSYLVNKVFIHSIGKAQGKLQLYITKFDLILPVSRRRYKELRNILFS